MNRFILFKGAAAGLIAGVLGMLLLGASSPVVSAKQGTSKAPAASLPATGRYQVASSAAMFLILDTATGQAWMGDFHNTLKPEDPAFLDPKLQPVAPALPWE